MNIRRKHNSDISNNIKKKSLNLVRKYKSQVLQIEGIQQLNINIIVSKLVQQMIDNTIQNYQKMNFINKHVFHLGLITQTLAFSMNNSPNFLEKPKKLTVSEFQREKRPKVEHPSRIVYQNTTIRQDKDKYQAINPKQVVNRLKKQYILKSKISKQNMDPFKLPNYEQESQSNELSYQRSALRGIKKYTQKNLKIRDLAKHEAMLQGKGSRDDQYVLDSDAKPLKIHKDNLNTSNKPKLAKQSILKTDISFNQENLSNIKPEQIKLRKKPSNTYHFSQQNQKSDAKAHPLINYNLPAVQQLQSSLQIYTNLQKNVKIKQTQHKLLTRLSKFNTAYTSNAASRKYLEDENKLPLLNVTKRSVNR